MAFACYCDLMKFFTATINSIYLYEGISQFYLFFSFWYTFKSSLEQLWNEYLIFFTQFPDLLKQNV
jgi:hypothetical protein